MQSGNRSAKCVFVGNIPYDATEEQLKEVFQEVGPVVSFRLVFDRETGKPQGYGFCEFRDAETALSAMRNLNNVEFHGRNLRVDFAEKEKAGNAQAGVGGASGKNRNRPGIPPIPNNSQAPSTPETVNNMLEGMSANQVYDMVAKMKTMIQQNPDQARQILITNPPLAYALLQAQAILGMINVQTVQKLLTKTATPNMASPMMGSALPVPTPVAPPVLPSGIPPTVPTGMHPVLPMGGAPMGQPPMMGGAPMGQPPMGMYAPPPGAYPPAPMMGGPGGPMGGQPPVYGGMPPPNMAPNPMMGPQPGGLEMSEQQKLIQQLMSLTPDQIEKLPLEQRHQVQQLRQMMSLSAQGMAPRGYP